MIRKTKAASLLLALALLPWCGGQAVAGPLDEAKARAHLDAVAAGDLEALMRDYAEDAYMEWVGGPLDGRYRGKAEIRAVWQKFIAANAGKPRPANFGKLCSKGSALHLTAQPHLLSARVSGSYDGRSLDGTSVYAEKNWGAAFADHWWWGQGPGVAFAGGRIHGVAPTAVVAWTDRETIALAPPVARTVARAGGGEWHIRAHSPRWRIEIEGAADGGLRLPVPLPAERRLELRSNHHLTGQLEARVWRGRRLWLHSSGLAGLEDGAVSRSAS